MYSTHVDTHAHHTWFLTFIIVFCMQSLKIHIIRTKSDSYGCSVATLAVHKSQWLRDVTLTVTFLEGHIFTKLYRRYSILGISWKDRVTNEEVRVRTGQHSMDDILSERRLRWLGHVTRMDHQRVPRQALHWEVPGFKRGPGRPRTNWRSTVNKDLLRMGITWEEVEVAAQNRWEWRRSVAQCIHLDAGWIKVKVM